MKDHATFDLDSSGRHQTRPESIVDFPHGFSRGEKVGSTKLFLGKIVFPA